MGKHISARTAPYHSHDMAPASVLADVRGNSVAAACVWPGVGYTHMVSRYQSAFGGHCMHDLLRFPETQK